jgi:hypothetical protein
LEKGPTDNTETSVLKRLAPRNKPAGDRIHFIHGGRLQSGIIFFKVKKKYGRMLTEVAVVHLTNHCGVW